MKGGSVGPIILAGAAPALFLLLIFGLVVSGVGGWVLWRPPVIWTDQLGSATRYAQSEVVALASDGKTVDTTGYLNLTWVGNRYSGGVPFLRRYSLTGMIWTTQWSNSTRFLPSGLSDGADGVYVVGNGVNETLFKFGFDGSLIWNDTIGFGFRGMISATIGSLYFAGASDRPLTNQSFTGNVMFAQKYDSSGNKLWTSEFSNATDEVIGIQANASGVYILTDYLLLKYDLIGNELWSHPFASPGLILYPYSLAEDPTGVYVSGTVETSSLGPLEGFVTKYDSNGSMVWNAPFDIPVGQGIGHSSLWVDSTGIYVSFDTFVAKYDSNHNQSWMFQTPTSGVFDVAFASGELFLAGSVPKFGFVQAFSGSPSLIFFGLNPPVSFVVLGTVVAVVSLGVFFLMKRYSKRLAARTKSVSSERYAHLTQAHLTQAWST